MLLRQPLPILEKLPAPQLSSLATLTIFARPSPVASQSKGNARVKGAHPAQTFVCAAQPSTSQLPTYPRSLEPVRLAIFVSGGGSNFRAIHDAILMGRIHAEVSVRAILFCCLQDGLVTITDCIVLHLIGCCE